MNHPESIIQAQICLTLSSFNVFFFSVGNENAGKISMARAGRLRAMGLRSGMTDLVLIGLDGRAHFLEVKTPTGKLSPAQDGFRKLCSIRHWPWAIARSVQDAVDAARLWGLIMDRPV
jgi:hypothetical protein